MKIKLFFGIGNQGHEYEGTRHNVGFAFLDFAMKKGDYLCEKSDVFVNLSGKTLKKIKIARKLKNGEILVVHDDLDIEFGKYKLSFGKNSAGHKGVQSIIDALKTNKFWRLRIGIANSKLKNARKNDKVADFVLSKFTPTENEQLKSIFKDAYDRIFNG